MNAPRLWPIYLTAGITDFALYVVHGTLPFHVQHLGGGAFETGLVVGISLAAYVVAAIGGGRLSDRVPRLTLAKGGCLLFAASVLGIAGTRSIPVVTGLCLPMGVGMGFFWPPVQAHLADLASPARLAGALGRFNIAWSLGKGLGFFGAATLLKAFAPLGLMGAYRVCLVMGALFALNPLLLLGEGGGRRGSPERVPPDPDAGRGAPYRRLAWIANFYLYGSAAVLVAHHPVWVRSVDLREIHSEVFLGAVFLSQTLAFIFWSAYGRWRYRLAEFIAVQVAFVLVVALVPLPGRFGFTLLLAPVLGLGLGLGYQASLYYSLHAESGRGRLSGLHEGILGSGGFLMPPLAGYLAGQTGEAALPYIFAAIVGSGALLVQVGLARSR